MRLQVQKLFLILSKIFQITTYWLVATFVISGNLFFGILFFEKRGLQKEGQQEQESVLT
jgi:hypothetical protein